MTDVVTLQHVSKSYGGLEAVTDVSMALRGGEIVALVGHNGAGKTTLIKLMLGLIRPSGGVVRVLGDDPAAGQFAARRRLGFLPENVAFNMALTGRETLGFYAALKRVDRAGAALLLDRVGLAGAADRAVRTYSKGMRQRLGLAQALLGEPLVLLLDEPTTGLDPELRGSFYSILAELRDAGTAVLLSSHALTELEGRTDRVIVVHRGAKIADGSIADLRRLSRLPTRIRVRLADGDAGSPGLRRPELSGWRRINGHVFETEASPENKMALLRDAASQGSSVADLDLLPPTLDELYAHFLKAQGNGR
jgi:Cu-processing system ATP-binding protein